MLSKTAFIQSFHCYIPIFANMRLMVGSERCKSYKTAILINNHFNQKSLINQVREKQVLFSAIKI